MRATTRFATTAWANGKLLFDFADIESWDPDGTYYPDETDACNWCSDWCAIHTCPGCAGCAHSHCFNCYLKGKAFWWLMARMIGWQAEEIYCGDINDDDLINITDIVYLINYKYKGGAAPPDPNAADVNNDDLINILDITRLIDYKYKGIDRLDCGQ